jgi:predicted Zn-dependent peptidase
MTEPRQTAEKRATIEDPLARLTTIDIAYQQPRALTADADALSVLASVLSSGRSSRLYQALVRQKQVAVNAGAAADNMRGPGLFSVSATVAPGQSVEAVETALDEEIARVQTGTIEPWEIEKARNNAKRGVVGMLTSTLQRALSLSEYALFYDDPGLINTRYERVEAITAADVQRVARQYLTRTGRTVVITTPKADAAGGSAGGAR